jgi:signal transduction histidine kinase
MDEAILLSFPSLLFKDIKVYNKSNNLDLINVDKHNILQILVNLISNARHAARDSFNKDKTIILESYVNKENNEIIFKVIDNGIGILKENLIKIFNQGFSTKKEGHGFGLHSCALVAKNMGGSLYCESNGLNQGASFTLKIPYDFSKNYSLTSEIIK